jgi:predicted ABC-type ATPase
MSDLIAVVGPNGSGKSSLIYVANLDRASTFINPDDIARRDFASVTILPAAKDVTWVHTYLLGKQGLVLRE